jgi:hypothetical protein
MAINEGNPEAKGLRHPHKCVVDGAISMRVELSHYLASNASRFDVTAIWAQAHLAHLVDNASLNWL